MAATVAMVAMEVMEGAVKMAKMPPNIVAEQMVEQAGQEVMEEMLLAVQMEAMVDLFKSLLLKLTWIFFCCLPTLR